MTNLDVNQLLAPFRQSRTQWYLPRAFFPYPDRIEGIPGFHRFLKLLVEHQQKESLWNREKELEVLIMLEDEGITPRWADQQDYHAEFRNRINFAKKLGLAIPGEERPIVLTEVGRVFLQSQPDQLPDLFEHQLLKLQFKYPDLPVRYGDFKLFPYLFTLSLLLEAEGSYVTQEEFILRVMLTRTHQEKQDVLDWLGEFRSLTDADKAAAKAVLDQNHVYAARMWLLLFSNTNTVRFNEGVLAIADPQRARLVWTRHWPKLSFREYTEPEWGRWMGSFAPGLWPVVSDIATRHLRQHRTYVRREESDVHKGIKRHLIENCQAIWGTGSRLVEEEYSYPSGDSANLVFLLPDGRFLAVEVEVDVGPNDIVGLLQAVKYKYMLAIQEGRTFDEVHGMLVARSIHPAMKTLCENYGIGWREVTL